MPLIGTLIDTFNRSTGLGSGWTAAGAGILATGDKAYVNASYTNNAVVYSSLKTTFQYTLQGSQILMEIPTMPARNANAQIWMQPDQSGGVNRIGFEYKAPATGTITLDCIGQTTNYAAIGTTTTLTYDATAMRWLLLRMAGTTIYWETAPDGKTWTVRRTLTNAPTWTAGTTLQLDIEAFRNAAGTNDQLILDNINIFQPAWAPSKASTGTASWTANMSTATAVTAGYKNSSYNRQTAAGNDASSGLVWPPVTAVAPWGRPGRALQIRVPDGARRYELEPNVTPWADGNQFYVGFSFAFDGDLNTSATGYQCIWQLRPNDDTGSPPIALEVFQDGSLWLTGGYGRRGAPAAGTYSYTRKLLANVRPRQWYNVVMFVGVWSEPNSGRVDVWVDGNAVLTAFVPPPGTNYPYGTSSYPKNGIYHDAANRGATVWFADHKQGSGYTSVDPTKTITRYDTVEAAA